MNSIMDITIRELDLFANYLPSEGICETKLKKAGKSTPTTMRLGLPFWAGFFLPLFQNSAYEPFSIG
ncbi:MAG: hypothetical protein IPH84_08875 [Bacteroidales bacterium]|nr:hypothetical protein [Bacteroidales bacterium]